MERGICCPNTVNVDIFMCINFRGFDKMGSFKIFALCGMINVIFTVHIFSCISEKRDLRANMYSSKISTFTAYISLKDFSKFIHAFIINGDYNLNNTPRK